MINADLYNALVGATARGLPDGLVGAVKVSDPGKHARVAYRTDVMTGKVTAEVESWGEAYRVNCPYCGDTEQRLRFASEYGRYDPRTGRENWGLVACLNAGCPQHRNIQDDLRRLVYPHTVAAPRPRVIEVGPEPVAAVPCEDLPWGFQELHELEPSHKAIRFLEGRGYNVELCGEHYQMHYVPLGDLHGERLLVPFIQGDQLLGWSTRYLGDGSGNTPDHLLKWMHAKGTKKSRLLFNLEEAKQHDLIVVVEGVFDVLGVGSLERRDAPSCAVAALGKKLSNVQVELLIRHAAYKPIFVAFDGDAWSDTLRTVERLQATGLLARPVRLPEGSDPGDLSHAEFWTRLTTAAG